MEEQLNDGKELTESDVADQLEKYRSYVCKHYPSGKKPLTIGSMVSCRENEHFKGLSFPTISATGPNGGESCV